MKKLFLLVFTILSTAVYSQTPGTGWFELEMEFGRYIFTSSGNIYPNNQSILVTQNNDTLFYSTHNYTDPNTYRYAIINADTGDIDVKLYSQASRWYDNDGPDAFISFRNATQNEFLDLEPNTFGMFSGSYPNYSYDTVVNLLSQPPPIAGCMDTTSSTYNPNANINNDQCAYPVTFTVDMNSYPDTFSQVYVSGQFNSWSGISDSLFDNDGDGVWTGTIDIINNPGWLWKFSVDNWADQELPPQIQQGANNNPYAQCFLLDAWGFTNRNLIVDGAAVVLDTYCWERCYACEDIIGCTDSTSTEFNPWATISDGLCQGANTNLPTLGPGETYLEIVFTPDQYGSESSWILYDDNGEIWKTPNFYYSGKPAGVPIREYIAVDTNILVDIVINDTYGDGVCGTCFGGATDGNLEVYRCDGTKLFALLDTISDGDFGYQFLTPQMNTGSKCASSTPTAVSGCTDPFSLTYNPNATVSDTSCGTARIVGCTDTSAFNYNASANTSEVMTGNYTLRIYDGAANGWSGTWLGIKQGGDLSPVYTMHPDEGYSKDYMVPLNIYEPINLYLFTTPQSQGTLAQVAYTLFGPEGDTIVNVPYWGAGPLQFPNIQTVATQPTFGDVCIPKVFGCTDTSAFNYDASANTNDGSCIPVIVGCMNPLSFNYDSTANTPGTCIPVIVGCLDSTQFNYDPTANTAGACIPYIYGCTDSSKFNYNSLANTDDGSCVPFIYGCTDPTAFNYDSLANTNDNSCIPTLYGCTDSTAFNYNPLANTNNGSCIPVVYGCTNVNSTNYNPAANVDDSTCIPIIYGCTDSTAFNYNPLANTNNNTCIPKVYGCTNSSSLNYNPLANTDDGSCIPYIYGCTDSTALNYNPLANTDNGTCIPKVYGCTDPNSFNYDPAANVNQVSSTDPSNPCIPIVYGCTDSTAINYDPLANTDNGSCIPSVYGCTDPAAHNYNPNANVSDSSCVYDAGCVGEPGVPYWLNDPCYAWVIDVDEYCCNNAWDSDCQALYDYCAVSNGTVDIDEFTFDHIVVYPNPTTGQLNIRTNLDVTYTLYDFTGREVIEDSTEDVIDISTLPNGVYFLSIRHHDKVFNKRIVKED